MNNYFLISCWGKAASAWVAGSLHMHPEIKCSNGTDHPLNGFNFWFNNDEYQSYINQLDHEIDKFHYMSNYKIADENELTPENYIDKAGYGFMAAGNIARYQQYKFNKLQGIKIITRKPNLENLSFYLQELEQYSKPATTIGNIHGFYHSALYDSRFTKFLKKYNVVFANLVRDPIQRWESHTNNIIFCYNNYGSTFKTMIDDAFNEIMPIAKYHKDVNKVDFDDLRNKVLLVNLHYWKINYSLTDELRNTLGNCTILIERLKKEPDYFAWLVNFISHGKIIATNEYLDQVYSAQNLNAGRNNSTSKTDKSAYDIWHSWPDWLKMEFQRQIKLYDMERIFNQHGYQIAYS